MRLYFREQRLSWVAHRAIFLVYFLKSHFRGQTSDWLERRYLAHLRGRISVC